MTRTIDCTAVVGLDPAVVVDVVDTTESSETTDCVIEAVVEGGQHLDRDGFVRKNVQTVCKEEKVVEVGEGSEREDE